MCAPATNYTPNTPLSIGRCRVRRIYWQYATLPALAQILSWPALSSVAVRLSPGPWRRESAVAEPAEQQARCSRHGTGIHRIQLSFTCV
jgi:hypothetical protein